MSLGSLMWTALDLLGAGGDEDHNHRLQHVQEATFAQLRFQGADGQWLEGRAMQILYKGKPSAAQADGTGNTAAFWYCQGPDDQLYVAMPICFRIGFNWRVDWEVKPFSSDRHSHPYLLGQRPFAGAAMDGMHTPA